MNRRIEKKIHSWNGTRPIAAYLHPEVESDASYLLYLPVSFCSHSRAIAAS